MARLDRGTFLLFASWWCKSLKSCSSLQDLLVFEFLLTHISYSKTEADNLPGVTWIQTQPSPVLLLQTQAVEDCQTWTRMAQTKLWFYFLFPKIFLQRNWNFISGMQLFSPLLTPSSASKNILQVQMSRWIIIFEEMGSFPMFLLFYI